MKPRYSALFQNWRLPYRIEAKENVGLENDRHINLLLMAGLSILVTLVAVSTAMAQSGSQFALTWFSISSGSGTSEGGQFAVQDVIGEPLVDVVAGGTYSITTPFADFAVENLVLLYVNGDNNLSGEVTELVDRVQRGVVGANAVVYMLVDRQGQGNTTRYLLAKTEHGNCNLFSGRTCDGVYVVDRNMWPNEDDSTGEPHVLTDFIVKSVSRHPNAKKIILSMVGHGSGWTPNTLENQPPEHAGQPGGGLLLDENPAVSFLSTVELGTALADAQRQTGRKIDLLYLDACLMGMWEVAYEIKDSVNYLLAAESWSWTSFAYDSHLQDLQDSPSVPEIGRRWMQNERAILEHDGYAFTYSLLDLSQTEVVRTAIDGLVNALDPNDKSIASALTSSICFDSDWNSRLDDFDNYCDLYGFAKRLKQMFDGNTTITDAAQAVMDAVRKMVPEEYESSQGGVVFDDAGNAHEWQWDEDLGGVSLYMPLRQDNWKRRHYPGTRTESIKASQDGAWDEFLDAYWNQDPPAEPTCQGECPTPPKPITVPPKLLFLPVVLR